MLEWERAEIAAGVNTETGTKEASQWLFLHRSLLLQIAPRLGEVFWHLGASPSIFLGVLIFRGFFFLVYLMCGCIFA